MYILSYYCKVTSERADGFPADFALGEWIRTVELPIARSNVETETARHCGG